MPLTIKPNVVHYKDDNGNYVGGNVISDISTRDAVQQYLDDHPEATTTVQDGAITKAKLASDVKTPVDKVPVLESRMDTFSRLTEGSTTGDAELIDIRVGADGTTYPTAGDAVRGQITDLKEDLGEITGNESIPITATGSYIDLHTGTTNLDGPTTSSTASHLIASCSAGDQFIISTVGGESARAYGFVGSDRTTVISRSEANLTCEKLLVTAPENAAYLVVNAVSNNQIKVYKNNLLVNRVAINETNIADLYTRKLFIFDSLDPGVEDIPVGSDLNSNTYITVGNYRKKVSGTILNSPVEDSIHFGLKVFNISLNNSFCQLLIPTAPSSGYIWYRLVGTSGGNPSFGTWHKIADERNINNIMDNVFVHHPTIITQSNVTTYFPNSSFNDAKPNTIYAIAEYIDMDGTPIIQDGPPGDQTYGVPVNQAQTPDSPVKSWGARRGTLLTYTQALGETDASGLTQIFIQYPGYKNYYGMTSPSISFRTAYYENNSYIWSDWSKLSQDGVLHAGNGIVYGGQPYIDSAPFADLNDAPFNSIFHIDRNMNNSDEYHTLGHHPVPGQSSMVITYAFSPGFNHCRVQVVYALNGKMFWRYEYLDNGQHWTSWYEIKNTTELDSEYLRNKGRLANGTDLNTITENAIYFLAPQGTAQYVNNPLASNAGYLTAKLTGSVCLQVVESLAGTRYSRYTDNSGTTWSNWV